MKALTCSLVASAILLTGCGVAHDVAVTSFEVATAPIRFVDRQIDNSKPKPPVSDVTTPGRPVATASPSKQPRPTHTVSSTLHSSKKPATTRKSTAQAKPSPSPTSLQFPTAKAVPGKPGYVFSPSDPNKYVDVNGYAPGSKVKDPYSGKIFLVP